MEDITPKHPSPAILLLQSYNMPALTPKAYILGRLVCTKNRLDAYSFQQDAITSFRNWQYCAYYTSDEFTPNAPRYVTLARRCLTRSESDDPWERIIFHDYEQTTDDGHNTISIGISAGDGTIHLSFDHHCDQLHFRISQVGLATDPENALWSTKSFSQVLDRLPGTDNQTLTEVTYPRFLAVKDMLIFECRIGMAGEGSDVISSYDPSSGTYSIPHTYLIGVGNNPYINGLSYDPARNRIHVSWTYRQFVDFDKSSGAHRQQAGPNGPENNRDLAYAYSDDLGRTWQNTNSENLGPEIRPDAPGIIVRDMLVDSGILNQESQCVDRQGNFHVLMRDKLRTGRHEWRISTRFVDSGEWRTLNVPGFYPTAVSLRGSICCDLAVNVYLLLPEECEDCTRLSIVRVRVDRTFEGQRVDGMRFRTIWTSKSYDGEPSVNVYEWGGCTKMSIFTTQEQEEAGVQVLDFDLTEHVDEV